jgi:hypothetical protein
LADIAAPSSILRLDGAIDNSSSATQGAGNFLAYPLYIGARGGTGFWFTGHLYSLIARFGAGLDATTISSTETWVAGKTGITI